MSKRSDKHERLIANHLNMIPDVDATRPIKGTDYSDVLINYKGKDTWLEIKMNHQDNLANPRVYYQDKVWNSRYITPVAGNIVQYLNKTQESREFIYSLSDYCGLAFETIYVPTTISQMGAENAVPKEAMKSYCKENGGYIIDKKDYDLTELINLHYTQGKKEPAFYMQAGDDFFMISNTNPLGLSSDIPQLQGTGKYRVRVSNRSKFYEIQTELKMTSTIESEFSVLPGSFKQNPFL